MDRFMEYVRWTAKAVSTGLIVVITFLTTILTGNQTLADVTFVQWLVCAGMVLGAYGVVYKVPNGPRPEKPVA